MMRLLAIALALASLARAFPHVAWLRVFRPRVVHLSEEQKAKQRRSANRQTALEIIVAGLALPLLYVVSTVMMFNDFKTIPTLMVSAGSVSCIALGIWIFVRNRQP
jgi:high-affinity K+ transport system ATPase subunit B